MIAPLNLSAELFAMLALLPAVTGPPPAQIAATNTENTASGSITLALCNGGKVSVPLQGGPPARGTAPCCAKGCHSAEKRRKLDRKQ